MRPRLRAKKNPSRAPTPATPGRLDLSQVRLLPRGLHGRRHRAAPRLRLRAAREPCGGQGGRLAADPGGGERGPGFGWERAAYQDTLRP